MDTTLAAAPTAGTAIIPQNAEHAEHAERIAATDKAEYWAVAVERHFRPQAGEVLLPKKDPALAKLIVSVFGDAQIPLCR